MLIQDSLGEIQEVVLANTSFCISKYNIGMGIFEGDVCCFVLISFVPSLIDNVFYPSSKDPQSERLNVMVDILKHVKPTPNRKDVFTKQEANKKKIIAVEKRIAKRAAEMDKEQVGIQSLWQGYQNKMVLCLCVSQCGWV